MLSGDDLKLERANFIDAIELSKVCAGSFDQEMALHRDGKPGGPRGYDDPNWHIYSMKEGVYHKILHNDKIIGAIIMALRGKIGKGGKAPCHWELVQMFVDSGHKNKGAGTFAIKQVEEWFTEMYKMTAGTPSFCEGNLRFYKNLGFKITGEEYCEDEKITIVLLEKIYFNP